MSALMGQVDFSGNTTEEVLGNRIITPDDFIVKTVYMEANNFLELEDWVANDENVYEWEAIPADFMFSGVCFSLDLTTFMDKPFLESNFMLWVALTGESKVPTL